MRISKKFLPLSMAGALLLTMVGAAAAAPGVATGNVNLRNGPSVAYDKIGSLQAGQIVDVQGCRSGWCYVQKRGTDGWVSYRYLKAVAVRHRSQPGINFSFSFGTVPNYGHHNSGNGHNGGQHNEPMHHNR